MNTQRYVGLNLAENDKNSDRRTERALFGFWVFLMSDAVIFALLFATYGVQSNATVGGPTPQSEFKLGSALIETLILLSSSFTFGMASIAMKYQPSERENKPILVWMSVTLTLGLIFLGLELHDFIGMFGDGAYPTRSGFLSAFFALVPLHGIHVLVGVTWLAVLMAQIRILGCDQRARVNVLRLGLFWHFLDLVWIAIFSVVYLNGLLG